MTKFLGKGINVFRKGENWRFSSVRNSMGEELTRENYNEARWAEYFVQLLNGDETSEVKVRRAMIEGNEE